MGFEAWPSGHGDLQLPRLPRLSLQEAHLGVPGCGLGALLDEAVPQTRALAGAIRARYGRLVNRRPSVSEGVFGGSREAFMFFLVFVGVK